MCRAVSRCANLVINSAPVSTEHMRWLATTVVCGLSIATACSAWSADSKLREAGPTPYVRCLAAPAPKAQSGQFGQLGFALQDRTLTLKPKRWPLRMAAFSAPGFGPAPRASDLAPLRQANVDLLLMLGGLGDSEANAEASAKALAGLGKPLLVLLGGRDRLGDSESAIDAAGPSIMNITALRAVRIAGNTLVPVAGADHGRYAVADDACGFGAKDLAAIATDLGAVRAGERRWLVSWQAAAGTATLPSPAVSATGLDLGSPDLGRFAQQIGAVGALCAWPAGRYEPLVAGPLAGMCLPRLYGPWVERPDGTRVVPGFVVIELDDQGLRVVR